MHLSFTCKFLASGFKSWHSDSSHATTITKRNGVINGLCRSLETLTMIASNRQNVDLHRSSIASEAVPVSQ